MKDNMNFDQLKKILLSTNIANNNIACPLLVLLYLYFQAMQRHRRMEEYDRQYMVNINYSMIMITKGQRPNESQKAVTKDVMKSVGEIACKIWPVV